MTVPNPLGLGRLYEPRLDARGMGQFLRGLARARLGSGPVRICALGHSITQGWSATSQANAWANIAAQDILTDLGGGTLGRGLVGCGRGFGYTPGWTESGSHTFGTSWGPNMWNATIAVGGYLEQAFTCDEIRVYGLKANFVFGAVVISIDGTAGGPNVVAGDLGAGKYDTYSGAIESGTNGLPWTWHSGAMSAASHTLRLAQASGSIGNLPGLCGAAQFFNGEQDLIEFYNLGHFGYNTAQHDTPSSSESWAAWLPDMQPDLIVVEHGVNNSGTAGTTSGLTSDTSIRTYHDQLGDVVDYARVKATTVTPSIMLAGDLCVASRNYSVVRRFADAARDVAASKGCGYHDFLAATGDMSDADHDVNDWMAGDYVHPNDDGHAAMGHSLSDHLLDLPVVTDRVTTAGLELAWQPAAATGNRCQVYGNQAVAFRNDSGSDVTVTVTAPAASEYGGTGNIVVTVPAGGTRWVRMTDARRFADAEGEVSWTYSSATGVLVAAAEV